MLAHPADLSGRHTSHEGVRLYVAVDDRPSSHKGIFAEGGAADYGGVGADGDTALDQGVAVLFFAADGAAGVVDVGKDHAGPAEHVVFQRDVVVHRDVVLNLAVVADHDAVAYKDVLAKGAIAANLGATADVHPVPDAAAFANLRANINDGRGVNGDAHVSIPTARQRACRHGMRGTWR